MQKIKAQLEAKLEEIVQHQNLLERKLTDQLEDITRQRTELDELERSSIEEMLKMDKQQRDDVGSSLESFLAGPQLATNMCTCGHLQNIDSREKGTVAEAKVEDSSSGALQHIVLFYLMNSLFFELI